MKSPVMYLIANKGLGMSAGKLAAQVAHAAVRVVCEDYDYGTRLDSEGLAILPQYLERGETKIVLEARDTEHLLLAQKYIEARGFKTFLVIDEGRTEIPALSATVLGIQLVDKADDKVKSTFETFKTYKDGEPLATATEFFANFCAKHEIEVSDSPKSRKFLTFRG